MNKCVTFSRVRSLSRRWARLGIIFLATAALIIGLAAVISPGTSPRISQSTLAAAADSPDLIQFLQQTVGWYRQLAVEQQVATGPNDVMVVNDDRQIANQVVQLAFDFARAKAASTAKPAGSDQAASEGSVSSQYQALAQLSTKLDQDVQELQGEVTSVKQKLETASGQQRRDLQSTLAETQSELDLANARRDAVHSMAEFVGGASTNGSGATGLRAEIEALARSVPGALTKPATSQGGGSSASEPLSFNPASVTRKAEPSGLWGLTADLFTLSRGIHALGETIQATDTLAKTSNQLRAPLVDTLKQLSRQGDDLAKQADTADAATLVQEKKQLDALTAQFKQTSALVLPLSKQTVLLGLYDRNLTDWQSRIGSQYQAEMRDLLVRLVLLGVVLAGVVGISELSRRTIFRYVHDVRRRYQFLLLRKIVLWFTVVLVIAFAFANELGSVATFAGLITAGVAVALQSVILSIAGYFFLIGRFGIRVGDRVQIAGVTGEVVDVGLVRLHLMELGSGGSEAPSGRVVAFPNSVVFQSTAGLFKQIPGTNFVWHEITLTLSPDSDWGTVEKRVHEAVEAAFSDYRGEMERQQRQMERTLASTAVPALWPRSRLRLTPSGLEVVIRFPVDSQHATEIDNRVTRELLKAIDREPALKLAGSGAPSVRLRTDLSALTATSG
ncbi:MAG TPA: mechanosensitive ion channel family protein [Terriglobia bacterium]|nr:mechanosensitive ion channel family protein [Terriglobia bacterium]